MKLDQDFWKNMNKKTVGLQKMKGKNAIINGRLPPVWLVLLLRR